MGHYLNEDQVDRVWDEHGMKHRLARLHDYMVSHGLGPMAVRKDLFLKDMKQTMIKFFVEGLMEDKDGRQRFPGEANDSNGEG